MLWDRSNYCELVIFLASIPWWFDLYRFPSRTQWWTVQNVRSFESPDAALDVFRIIYHSRMANGMCLKMQSWLNHAARSIKSCFEPVLKTTGTSKISRLDSFCKIIFNFEYFCLRKRCFQQFTTYVFEFSVFVTFRFLVATVTKNSTNLKIFCVRTSLYEVWNHK